MVRAESRRIPPSRRSLFGRAGADSEKGRGRPTLIFARCALVVRLLSPSFSFLWGSSRQPLRGGKEEVEGQ